MDKGRRARRLSLLSGVLAAAALAAAPAVAEVTVPELDVFSYRQAPGDSTDINLDVVLVPSAPSAAGVAITVPAGYQMVSRQVGTDFGAAELQVRPAAGGAVTSLKGAILVSDTGVLGTDPQTSLCAPGTHSSAWRLVLNGSASITIPVAVDQLSSGGSYKLSVCLGAVQAAQLTPVDLYLQTQDVFRNPQAPGVYRWSALVTTYDTTGTPEPSKAFEVRGDEPLPETLTANPSYDVKKQTLTITGSLLAAHKPRGGVRVHLLAGRTPNSETMKEIGAVVTNATGGYRFVRRMSSPPGYVYGHVRFYFYPQCAQPSTAPGGCESETIDGTDSSTTKVAVKKK